MPPTSLVFHLVPHTHWDREWYLQHAAFRVRLVAMLDDLIARLRTEPELRSFLLDGQTVHVEDYLAVRPERREEIAALVAAGRLQVGPWYVLADELIPSGEALMRNLLAGATDAAQLGGRLDALYSPDAFGHPAALPLLAREFGLRWAVLWRGLGGEPGQERDLFSWRGAAGAELPLFHLPPMGYEAGAGLPTDPAALRREWRELRRVLVARAASRHVLVPVGADHHAVHRDVPRLRELLAELEPGHDVRVSRLDEFLELAVAGGALAPVSGELRWSYGYTWTLQGQHGTRARQKRRNSELELLLERGAEPLAALTTLAGRDVFPNPSAPLRVTWRELLRGQFHDTLCGTAVDAVARALDARHDSVEAAGREIARAALLALSGHDADRARAVDPAAKPALLVWNPAPRPRGAVVELDATWFRADVLVGPPGARRPRRSAAAPAFHLALVGEGGEEIVPVQVLSRTRTLERLDAARHYPDLDEVDRINVAARLPAIGGLALARLEVRRGHRVPRGGASARGRTLANAEVDATIERDGSIALAVGDRRLRGLLRLETEPDLGDTYTFAPARGARPRIPRGPTPVRIVARGPLIARAQSDILLGDVRARLTVSLDADSPLVRCRFGLDNDATDTRLRARLPLGWAGAEVLAGAPFGTVRRAAVGRTRRYPIETPAATAPAHRFVALAGDGIALALLAPGFFEYELTPEGDLLFTLFRAIGELSRGDLPTRRGHAAWAEPTPLAQSQGPDSVELALLPLDASALARPERIFEAWEAAFVPLTPTWLRAALDLAPADTGVTLSGEGLVFSSLKPAESGSGVVLRAFNARPDTVRGTIRFAHPVRRVRRSAADERDGPDLPLGALGTSIDVTVRGGDLFTLLID